MASRGRDWTFSILSDTDKLDLDKPARELEDLGTSAKGAGADLERLDSDAKGVDLDRLGTDARDLARKVDNAFDAIARASKTGANKVDDNTDKMRASLRDVSDEAGSTAREAAASFSSSGDIGDALQELAANAPAVLGPLGLALGAAAAAGFGLWRSEMEKLNEDVQEMVDEMLEAGGRLSEQFIDNKVLELAKEGELDSLQALIDQYDILGVTYRDLARAKAGDAEAIDRVTDALDKESARRKTSEDDMIRSEAAVAALRDQYDDSARALELAQAATERYTAATAVSGDTAKTAAATAKGSWDELRGAMSDPIRAKVLLQKPSAADFVAVRQSMLRGLGTIVVPVKAGTPRTKNTADNSRYRE